MTPDMTPDEVLGRLSRVLGPEELDDVRRRIDSGESIRWIVDVLRTAEQLPLPEVPAVLAQELRRLYSGTTVPVCHVASLISDSRAGELAGVRGADNDRNWSLSYASAVADVVVDVWPRDRSTYDIESQVLLHAQGPPAFRAVTTGPVERSAESDRLGRVQIEELPAGTYELRLDNGEVEVVLELMLDHSP